MNLMFGKVLRNKVALDICIFAVYFFFTLYETNLMLTRYQGEDRNRILLSLTVLWSAWAYVYTRGVIDYFLLRKKIAWYVSFTLVGIIVTSAIQYDVIGNTSISERNTFSQILINILIFTALTTLVYLGAQYLIKSREFFELEGVKKEVELTQLKNQLNPHFLFNALNNIYSYSLESNNHGSDLVMKLSQLMRFILETNKSDRIPLHQEITFIDNYVAFEKERLGYRCDIQFSKDVENLEILIPPLLLFPLIENAFKHGTNTLTNTVIRIILKGDKHKVTLEVENARLRTVGSSTQTGLTNLRRRLQLLFPSGHHLDTKQTDNLFRIALTFPV